MDGSVSRLRGLDVLDSNEVAKALYKKFGFQEVSYSYSYTYTYTFWGQKKILRMRRPVYI